MISSDIRRAMARKWPLRIRNGSGEVIPPFAVMRRVSVAEVDDEMVVTCAKPNSASTDFFLWYLVNGPFAIGTGSSDEGIGCSLTEAGKVLYNTANTPALNEIWGPKHNQWTLEKNYYGFVIEGGSVTEGSNSAVVARQIGVQIVYGKMDNDTVALGSTCTVSVWDGIRGADITCNLTNVYNGAIAMTSVTTKECAVGIGGFRPELLWVRCG